MRVPMSWLREYVAVEASAAEIAARLSISTAEVNEVVRRGVPDSDGNLGLFRVGLVLEAGKHPNADRLQLCQVDVGEGEPRQIVCGAWNFGGGATVAVALPGAVLPGGRRLEAAKLRGERSDGMILSERELELGSDHSGILVLDGGYEPGTPLADALPLGEDVLELETTPNRPDLLAVYGVARDVAALYGLELAPPPGSDPPRTGDEPVDVAIEDLEGCPRYIGRLFRDVHVAPSPLWLRARLVAAGIRPISNVVDVTNYVMHALGNPLHAFDVDRLHGGRIIVRRARDGEELRTLDGTDRLLDARDLVIADSDRAVAVAGIMGGEDSEVGEQTTSVLLEAANFEPVTVLHTSERLSLRTDGSNRWEKGVDPYLAEQAAAFATQLVVELAEARWTGARDVQGSLAARPVIGLRPQRTNVLLGLQIDEREQRSRLERLEFDVDDAWMVTVPTWRARDVTREADVVEEIARFRLDDVPFTLPLRRTSGGRLPRLLALRRDLEDILVGFGCSEAYTPSLQPDDPDPAAIRLPIPLTAEHAVLRTTLVRGLVEAARTNVRAGNDDVSLFEIARVYLPPADPRPTERWRLGAIVAGGFAEAKGMVDAVHGALHVEARFQRTRGPFLHPGKAARFEWGWVGELHPVELEGRWGVLELDLADLAERLPAWVVYRDVITYPPVRQELAFVLDTDVPAGDVFAAAREAAAPELREIRFLSDYREPPIPPGKKSLAFSVAFQSSERTLTDADAAELRGRIVDALARSFGAELRG
ncbi:MAG TPA: phenylalanine--tRNA ligase subunit beta, partial [Gaiellaceae bacterium]|nr:phenylalanine--tRNA ligase subunit beta [Gaiellaceae bacterium]